MKVLLATDGSSHSRHAETLARRIPSFSRGTWTVATVVAPPFIPMMGLEPIGAPMLSDDLQSIFDAQLEAANRVLHETQARLQAAGITSQVKLLEGDATDEVLNLAEEGGFDAVVIGSRGLGGLESFLLGSVAKSLVQKCPASVLVGRRHGSDTIEESTRRLETASKLTVAIGTDGSPGSDHAIDAVRASGEGAFESIALVAAVPLSGIPVGIGATDVAAEYVRADAEVESILHERAERLKGVGAHVSTAHASAEPDQALSSYASQKSADLIVVGSARHGFFDRIVLGSSAAKLAAHAPCSVWIVRPTRSID